MYKAFISYSHKADVRLAQALHSGLRRIGKPWYGLPRLRIFRDKVILGATDRLWPTIKSALKNSEYFLLMASPQAAQSQWVSREVTCWIENRSIERLIIVLTDGELVWNQDPPGFDPVRSTALNEQLFNRFEHEPLYVDLRWAKTEENLSLRHSRFRTAVLDIASPLYGKPRDALDDEDVRHSRRARQLAAMAIIGLAGLTLATGLTALIAQRARVEEQNQRQRAERSAVEAKESAVQAELRRKEAEQARREADRERNIAVEQRDLAICRQLAAQVNSQLERRLDLALLLAAEGRQMYECAELSSSLLAALQNQPRIIGFLTAPDEASEPRFHNRITDVAFSADGRMIAATGWAYAHLWDVKTRKRIGRPLKAMYGLTFTPDGNTLISTDGGESVVFWNTADSTARGVPLGHGKSIVMTVELSPNGKLLATGTEPTGVASAQVRLWDATERKALGKPLPGYRHAFSPDGKTLATSGEDYESIVLWDLERYEPREPPLEGHTKNIRSLTFSPDGRRLASGGEDSLVIVWDLDTRASHSLTGHTFPVNGLAFSHDGRMLASASGDKTIILWDTESLLPIGPPLTGASGPLFSVRFSPDDRILASNSGDDRVILWDVSNRPRLGRVSEIPQSGGSRALLSADGRTLAFTDNYGSILLWDLNSGKPAARFGDRVTAVDINPDGKLLAAVSRDGFLSLWDVSTDQPVGSRFKLGDFRLWSVRFSPDGKTIACGGDTVLTLWDVRSRKIMGRPRHEQRDRIWSLAFSPDGKLLAAGGNQSLGLVHLDGSARLEHIPVAQQLGLTRADVAFSPDGKFLAFRNGSQGVSVWDLERRRPDGLPLKREDGRVSSLAFTPDGQMLVSGGSDGSLILWDVATRQQLGRPVSGHDDDVSSVAFSADGGTMISVSQKQMIMWDFRLKSWMQTACGIANRNLTPSEWSRYFPGAAFRPSCRF